VPDHHALGFDQGDCVSDRGNQKGDHRDRSGVGGDRVRHACSYNDGDKWSEDGGGMRMIVD
jgi:hypothetical protein